MAEAKAAPAKEEKKGKAPAAKEAKAPKEHAPKAEVKKIPKGRHTVLKLADGTKIPKYTEVKKTSEYTVWKKRNGRYSVEDKHGNWVSGEKKTQVLLSFGLIKISMKKAAA